MAPKHPSAVRVHQNFQRGFRKSLFFVLTKRRSGRSLSRFFGPFSIHGINIPPPPVKASETPLKQPKTPVRNKALPKPNNATAQTSPKQDVFPAGNSIGKERAPCGALASRFIACKRLLAKVGCFPAGKTSCFSA